jgi:hypothetical protein
VASRAEEYRSLARECLAIAHTFPIGKRRTTLLQMAQVWQRLADQQSRWRKSGSVWRISSTTFQILPVQAPTEVRASDQSQDRQGARPRCAAVPARARRRGDRVKTARAG